MLSLKLKRIGEALMVVALAAVMLALFPAVAEAQAEAKTKDKSTPSSVEVRPGDSLWSISEERLGPNATPQQIANAVDRVYALNRGRIGADPNLIFPGQNLLLAPVVARATPTRSATESTHNHATARATESAPERPPRSAVSEADPKVRGASDTINERAHLPDMARPAPVPEASPLAQDDSIRSPAESLVRQARSAASAVASGTYIYGRLLGAVLLVLNFGLLLSLAFLVAQKRQGAYERDIVAENTRGRATPAAAFEKSLVEQVMAKDLLATPQDQEHADVRSEAIELLNKVLADGPVTASQVKQEAKDARISERTLARAKKTLGVMSYREGETGERGKGRWLWKLPAVDLMDDIEDPRLVIKDAEGCQEQHGGSLNQSGGLEETESRIAKPDVLRVPPTEEVPIKDANPIKDARVPSSNEEVAVSLVIPAYNEEHRLSGTLGAYIRELRDRYEESFEIVVVANGSSDGTVGVARRAAANDPHIRVVEIEEAVGKGGAVLEGFRRARGAVVAFADADGATAPGSLIELFKRLAHSDLVIGSRRIEGSIITRPQTPPRRLFGSLFASTARLLFGMPFRDTQCGAKAMHGKVARQLCDVVSETRWTFDLDLLLCARRLGLKISEHPVSWADKDGSHLRYPSIAWEVLRALWGIKRRQRLPLKALPEPPILGEARERVPETDEKTPIRTRSA